MWFSSFKKNFKKKKKKGIKEKETYIKYRKSIGGIKMKSIKSMLSSPKRIALFAVCAVLIIAVIAFSVLYAIGSIANNQGIGLERATNVALQNAGYTESEVTGLRGHYDRDDNLKIYEIEFYADGFEYDYKVAAEDGTILEANRELTNQINGGTTGQNSSQGITSENNQQSGNSSNNQSDNSSQTQNNQSDNSSQTQNNQSSSAGQSQTQQSSGSSQGQQTADSSQYIGTEKAKQIALNHAGVSSSSATFTKTKLDRDDGIYVYEIEFISGEIDYDYEINATTGNVISFDTESIYD